MIEQIVDRRQRGFDSGVVRNDAVFHRHVEINADDNTFPVEIVIPDCVQLHTLIPLCTSLYRMDRMIDP